MPEQSKAAGLLMGLAEDIRARYSLRYGFKWYEGKVPGQPGELLASLPPEQQAILKTLKSDDLAKARWNLFGPT